MPTAIPYREEKIKNAVCFFAKEHEERTRRTPTQTFIYKYLAFLDFRSVETTGRPALDLTYQAMKRGPVPIELYYSRADLKNDCFSFIPMGEGVFLVKAHGEPDLDYFSQYELSEMKRLIDIYADRFLTTDDISQASHQDIKAWQKAWEKEKNSIIDYALVFDGDIEAKGELSYPEETYLLYKALKKAC